MVTEPASVVAARQLADEARARRSRTECSSSAVTSARTPPPLRTQRARAALLAAAAAGAADCWVAPDVACSPVHCSPALDEGWPSTVDRVVAEVTAAPDFVRVDGTEECGGDVEARIAVPAS